MECIISSILYHTPTTYVYYHYVSHIRLRMFWKISSQHTLAKYGLEATLYIMTHSLYHQTERSWQTVSEKCIKFQHALTGPVILDKVADKWSHIASKSKYITIDTDIVTQAKFNIQSHQNSGYILYSKYGNNSLNTLYNKLHHTMYTPPNFNWSVWKITRTY